MDGDVDPQVMAAEAVKALMADDDFKQLVARASAVVADGADLPGLVAMAVIQAAVAEAARDASVGSVGEARDAEVPWQVIADAFGVSVPTAYARFTEKGRRDSARRQREFRARQLGGD